MAPTIHARSEWTSRAPTGSTPIKPGSINIVDVHWPATKGKIARTASAIAAALRGWQSYHMDSKGWRDIAYNVGVDLNGDVWLLRGWDVQDGGVSGRSDDVTILAIMGDADTVTDAMKNSILWCMSEFDRRRRRTLRRTHHGALVSTTCPGPQLTAWSKAGFPAPTTTQEDDMPLTNDDLDQIYRRVWFGGAGLPLIGQRLEGGGAWPETVLGALTDRIVRQQVAPLRGEIAGLTTAVGQLATSQGLDPAAIRDAVRQAVTDAVASIETTVTVRPEGSQA